MEDFKPVRVEPSDPTRCQAVGQNGEQCPFQGMPDPTVTPGAGGMSESDVRHLKYCRMHGSATAKATKKEAQRLYKLKIYKDRVERMLDPDVGVNLDEELAVLRMTLEAALNRYEEVELLTQSSQITGLVRDIRDTLTANKKLKSQMGELLDRAAMHKLCDALVVVISKHVPPAQLDEVAADVAAAVAQAVASRMEGQ